MTTDSSWIEDRKRGQTGEPHDARNGTIDREKDASSVCFLIKEQMFRVKYPAQGNTV